MAIRHLIEKYWRPDIALFVGAMLLSAGILAANAITLSNVRDETLRSVEASMESQAIVLAQESDRSFKVLDFALSIIADDIARLGVTDSRAFQRRLAEHDVHELLKEKSAGLSHVDAISLISVDGKLINVSRRWPIPDVDVSDREYFQWARNAARRDLYISAPYRGRAGPGPTETEAPWVVSLTRR